CRVRCLAVPVPPRPSLFPSRRSSDLLERHGLKEHAQAWITRLRGATAGRLLIAYLGARQLASALGLTSLGGHPQTVRPLLAPMAEAAAEARHGQLPEDSRERLKALCAATANV